jgi:hypothetical protein
MKNTRTIHIKGKGMKTYVVQVVIEADCPALLMYGAAM